ncbi:MAG: zinc-binding metallopeptidase family protein [Acidithiobacillus ferriphilus]
MKTFTCPNCANMVFFESTVCENCNANLGFVPEQQFMAAFFRQMNGSWEPAGISPQYNIQPCRNYESVQVCNWMVAKDDGNDLCQSCRYTEIIPQLSLPENLHYWYLLEAAKRRLIYSLEFLGLPIPGRTDDPQHGLAFRFIADSAKKKVLTGHSSGVITLNVLEANDAEREKRRFSMHEPYRTLLGHFRHEIGHFYWDYLIAKSSWMESFREIFGDESRDYQEALQQYYQTGPATNWQMNYISSYATMHPWEDWAETWAQYLHIKDTLETAINWGVSIHVSGQHAASVSGADINLNTQSFREMLIEQWLPLTQFLNSMNRSLGQQDSYPFVLTDVVINKLEFVDQLVKASRR